MLQKMIRVGNSYAVTIPKGFVESVRPRGESFVEVYQDPKKGKIVIDFMEKEEVIEEVVDKEVYKIAKQLLRRYLPAFKELAKK